MKSAVLDVKTNEDGEQFIEIPEDMLNEAGWKVGDDIVWSDNKDGSFTLTKSEHDLVLVETVSMFRMRYLVKVPKGKAEWALDTVTTNEAEEWTQTHLDENIVSHRVVNSDEAMRIFREDNGPGYFGDRTFENLKHYVTEINSNGDIVK
jgi:hypothetical protein